MASKKPPDLTSSLLMANGGQAEIRGVDPQRGSRSYRDGSRGDSRG